MVPVPVAYGIPTGLGVWMPVTADGLGAGRPFGIALVATGTVALLACFVEFVRRGNGTPAPYDPPRNLVAVGLYRLSRNPMYASVLLTVFGEALVWGSWTIVGYGAFLGMAFHGWVLLIEEPQLRARFGPQYEEYIATVPRWVGFARRTGSHLSK